MEQIMLTGEEWAGTENLILHKSGNQFMVTIPKNIIDKLGLQHRDTLKLYIKRDGHRDVKARENKGGFGAEQTERPYE